VTIKLYRLLDPDQSCQGGTKGWGIFMILWGLVITVIDNFIKPF
jgi:hypothetical protein